MTEAKTRLDLLRERASDSEASRSDRSFARLEIRLLTDHSQHVEARRTAKADVERAIVRESVALKRLITGATGNPEIVVAEPIRVLEHRKIPDPSMSDSEFIHQRARKPHDPDVGKVWAQENVAARIGALAFIRRRLSHHERAAEWFKTAYEFAYGGISPAIDAGRVRVDTSIMVHDDGAAARVDNGLAIRDTIDQLGADLANRVIAVVVLCIPCADFATVGPSGKASGHAVEREVDRLLDALDEICELRGFRTKAT